MVPTGRTIVGKEVAFPMENTAISELITRLQKISPMPDDEFLTPALIDTYQDLIARMAATMNPRCIRPMVESFGSGEADGAYWSTLLSLERFPRELLDPELIAALDAGRAGPCQWAAFMLGRSRNRAAVPGLVRLLEHEQALVRAAATLALGQIGESSVREHLEALRGDPAVEVRNEVRRALQALEQGAADEA